MQGRSSKRHVGASYLCFRYGRSRRDINRKHSTAAPRLATVVLRIFADGTGTQLRAAMV